MTLNPRLHKVIETNWSNNFALLLFSSLRRHAFGENKMNISFSHTGVKSSGQREVRLVSKTGLSQATGPVQEKCSGSSEFAIISNPLDHCHDKYEHLQQLHWLSLVFAQWSASASGVCQQEEVWGDNKFGLKRDFCKAKREMLSLISVVIPEVLYKRNGNRSVIGFWLHQFVHILSTSASKRINLVLFPCIGVQGGWCSCCVYNSSSSTALYSTLHLPSIRGGDGSTYIYQSLSSALTHISPSQQQ